MSNVTGLNHLPYDEKALTPAIKDHTALQFWGYDSKKQHTARSLDLSSYWHFFLEKCAQTILQGNGRHISIRSHSHILEIAEVLRGKMPRQNVRDIIRNQVQNTVSSKQDTLLDSSIDLVANLLLMIKLGSQPHAFSVQTHLLWDDASSSLEDFMRRYLKEPPKLGHERVKLEPVFHARNLERIAGLQLVWTDNLIDHLRLIDGESKVEIFHHASFLKAQSDFSVLPQDFVEETLRTLALLFPSNPVQDKILCKWYSKRAAGSSLDLGLLQCGRLKTDDRRIERFSYWHDRLVTLKQVFDEATPKTISQWWYDRRNGVQWYTFWIALLVLTLTILFGLIQCIEGGWQVRLAYVALGQSGSGNALQQQ